MPTHTNSIGGYLFIDLVGNIVMRQEQLELYQRLGVDGTGARRLGSRGRPFALRSVNYVASLTAAGVAMTAYETLIGANPVDIYQNSVLYEDYLVLSVDQVIAKAVASTIGGFPANTPNQCYHVCQWSLIAA